MNKKMQFMFQNLVHDNTMLKLGYSSSAKEFESVLKNKNVKLPISLSYDYKYPNNMTAAEYECVIETLFFCYTYPSFKDKLDFKSVKGLTDAERAELDNYIMQRNDDSLILMCQEWEKLVKLNPILKNIKIGEISDLPDLLSGVTYSFHPDDIKYFTELKNVNDYDARWAPQQKGEFKKLIGNTPGFLIAPGRVQIILDAMRMQLMAQKNNNQGRDK